MHRVWKILSVSSTCGSCLFNVYVLIQLYVVPVCSNPCDSCMLSICVKSMRSVSSLYMVTLGRSRRPHEHRGPS